VPRAAVPSTDLEVEESMQEEEKESLHSSEQLSLEVADNVMQLPKEGSQVIESKTICYCSNFDLNVNEWFNEYENIEIFKLNMKRNLGKYLYLLSEKREHTSTI
jgi:hypothetical protein